MLKNIAWLYKPYIKYGKLFVILSLLFWMIIMPATAIIPVYFPQMIIDALEAQRSFAEIIRIVVAFSAILLFIPMYEDVFNWCYKNKMLAKIDLDIRRDVYIQSLKTDYKYIDNPKYYDDYAWTLNEYSNQAHEAHNLILNLAASIITITVVVGIIVVTSPWIIILIVLNIVMRMFAHVKIDKLLLDRDEAIIPYDRKLDYFHRIFYQRGYSADLKSTLLKNYLLNKFEDNKNSKLNTIQKFGYKVLGLALYCDVVYRLSLALIMVMIVHGIYSGNIASIGMYITLILAVDRLDEHLFRLFDLIREAKRISMYGDRVRRFFKLESDIESNMGNGEIILDRKVLSVEFKNVDFCYDNSNFAISNFSLSIKPGEKVAIVGENGAGKTTFVKLLLRLYDIKDGEILINGIPLKEYDVHSLRRCVGVAFQEPNIYALSLLENIELNSKLADKPQLQTLLNSFGISKLISKNNASLDSELTKEFDDNGIVMSGGEIQKIGLARVFNRDFGLLILDEPSSALDPLAEYEMNKLILDSSNKSTTIMVAHRLSTIRDADKIVLIDNGTVRESGTHEELMDAKEKYYEMFTKQAENYLR